MIFKRICSVIVLLSIIQIESSCQTISEIVATLQIDTLLNNGSKDNRINFAIANLTNAEGTFTYNKEDLNTDVGNILTYFDLENPDYKSGFAQYKDFFNVYSVFFPEPLVFETVPSFYETAKGVRDDLFLPWNNEQYGWITMIYSFKGGGGGGAGVTLNARTGFAQLYGLDIHTTFHEFNHTMPGLADEYTASGGWSNFIPIEAANVTGQNSFNEIPWRKWINPELPLPTPYNSTYTNEIGLFEGNISGYFGSYRPTARGCYMGAGGFGENYGQDMCSVCLQRFVCMLYQYVNVIENPLPAATNIEINGSETISFSADFVKPYPNTQKYEWFVNDVLVASGKESFEMVFEACDAYKVDLVVTDTTEFVRYDEKFKDLYPEPKQTHTWTVKQNAVSTYNLAVNTEATAANCSGLATGEILVVPSGGTQPYQIYLNGIPTSSSIQNLSAGTYSVLVSDANGCSVNKQVEITKVPVLDFDIYIKQFGNLWNLSAWQIIENEEKIEDETSIEYLWSTGSTEPSIQVSEGTYGLSITSSSGCKVSREITINKESNPIDVFAIVSHSSSNENTGSILLKPEGTEPYETLWYEYLFTDQTNPISDQVIANGYTNGHAPIRAFDNSIEYTNFWADGFTGSNYIGFDFEKSIEIESYSITSNNDVKGRDAKSWILQGSDNAINWTDIEEVKNFEFPERQQRVEFKLDHPASHRYFRLLITENWGDGWLAIREVEFGIKDFQEMQQFQNKLEADELASNLYKYKIKDANNAYFEEIIKIRDSTIATQIIEVIQDGNYQVTVDNPNPELTYYWASDSEMKEKLHSGINFQPEESGQFYVQAYNDSLLSFVSIIKGFAVTMPESPVITISDNELFVADPQNNYEYIWYDEARAGLEINQGNSFTPKKDGYYFVAARKLVEPVAPINPGTISGIQLWMDASDLNGDGVTDGFMENSAAHDWIFKEGGRWREGDFFIYRNNYQNGLGVADFSTIWHQSLDGDVNRLRTVILVYEENELSLGGTAPLWGLNENMPRHTDASQLFADNTPASTLDGRTYLNGELVDPLKTKNPMDFIILSSVFTQLKVNSINATVMEWDGKVAELIVWDTELSHEEVVGVNEFLRKKWLSTADLESARTKIAFGSNPLEDKDQDGFDESQDCDDNDSNVNPDATEVCDGIDNNCNGEVDEGFDTRFYADADQDGFGDANSIIFACQAPDRYVSDNTDCDDNNANINSNQTEIPYNGIDDDCNAETLDDDLDQDGFLLVDDCDDTNADINPNQLEIYNNGIDENCDGLDYVLGLSKEREHTTRIYPNPASKFIYIDTGNTNDFTVQLYDILGNLLIQKDNTTKLAISKFQPGIYLLAITFHNSKQHRIIHTSIIK